MSAADILNYACVMPAWMEDAACVNSDFELWFSPNPTETDRAKKVCRGCPVVSQCLAFAYENDERHGVFGGLTAEQRIRRADKEKGDADAA